MLTELRELAVQTHKQHPCTPVNPVFVCVHVHARMRFMLSICFCSNACGFVLHLWCVCCLWQARVVDLLLTRYQADLTATTFATGATPLHLAAQSGAANALSVLISHGAPMVARDLDGWAPIHLAANVCFPDAPHTHPQHPVASQSDTLQQPSSNVGPASGVGGGSASRSGARGAGCQGTHDVQGEGWVDASVAAPNAHRPSWYHRSATWHEGDGGGDRDCVGLQEEGVLWEQSVPGPGEGGERALCGIQEEELHQASLSTAEAWMQGVAQCIRYMVEAGCDVDLVSFQDGGWEGGRSDEDGSVMGSGGMGMGRGTSQGTWQERAGWTALACAAAQVTGWGGVGGKGR